MSQQMARKPSKNHPWRKYPLGGTDYNKNITYSIGLSTSKLNVLSGHYQKPVNHYFETSSGGVR